jgi:hypothetical protein
MRSSDVLLHGAVTLLLHVVSDAFAVYASATRTPRHFLRQREPSWLFSGQTTSFSASLETWNEPVRAGLVGIACYQGYGKTRRSVSSEKMTESGHSESQSPTTRLGPIDLVAT